MIRFAAAAARVTDALAIAFFVAMFACVLAQVVFRYFLGSPLTWSDELARYLFVWCAFLGWVIAARRRSHLAVTIGRDRMSPRAQAALKLVGALAALAFAVVLVIHGVRIAERNWDVETTRARGHRRCRLRNRAARGAGDRLLRDRRCRGGMGGVADGWGAAMITLMLAVLGAWFLSLFAGPAIYAAMGLAGFAFLAFAGVAGIVIPQKMAMAANSFPLLAAPLFILMGNLMNAVGHQLPHLRLREGDRRLDARRTRAGEHRRQRDLRRHERLGGGRRGGARHRRDRGDAA